MDLAAHGDDVLSERCSPLESEGNVGDPLTSFSAPTRFVTGTRASLRNSSQK